MGQPINIDGATTVSTVPLSSGSSPKNLVVSVRRVNIQRDPAPREDVSPDGPANGPNANGSDRSERARTGRLVAAVRKIAEF